MIWAFASIVISGMWAYIAHQAIEFLAAKQRANDVAVLAAKITVNSKVVEGLEADVAKIKDRMGRLELKRS